MTERKMPATINQYCPTCRKVVAAALFYEFKENMMVTDISTCPCGLVLWEWHWGQPTKFANKPGLGSSPATRPAQMRLF